MKPFLLTSYDKTKLRKSLLYALKPGRRNAIKGQELAKLFKEFDDRRIRVAIRNLIKEGVPIASSVSEPMGYFIVANEFEAAEYIRVLRERIREDTTRLTDFQDAVQHMNVPEQLGLMEK